MTAHARRLLTLALAGLVAAVITRRPEFAGLAAPAVLLLAAAHVQRPTGASLRVSLPEVVLVEGTTGEVAVTVSAPRAFEVEMRIEPADDIAVGLPLTLPAHRATGADGTPTRIADAETQTGVAALRGARLPFTPLRWGYRPVGAVVITLRDRYRLTEGRLLTQAPFINCRPQPAQMNSSIVLSRLPSRLGEHASRAAGEGGEFAGVREFVPGDRQRRINWPATTRLGTLHLSTFAAERTQNVVVIADATADVGEPGTTSLDLVLRAACGAITHYLARRDRVGVIVYASRLNWIGPGQGQRHFQRLADLLVSSPAGWERAAGLTRLPRAALPPGSLILAFTPLLDPRLVEAIRDLRERGFPVVVVDVLNAEPGHDRRRLTELTTRVWRLEQQAIRFSLTQIGVPVAHWDGKSSLDEPLAPYSKRTMVVHR
ncbi:MAG TPA: DUF58 domain-containing protein [Streptosporangiaceae bacterium]|jgi:uncharacterized protein (DUF58 family)